jgi:hypothetical protein
MQSEPIGPSTISSPVEEGGAGRVRRSRISVLLLMIAVLISLTAGLIPHVIYRVPVALLTVWGLWYRRRWAYLLALVSAAVWLVRFVDVLPSLLVAPPWVLWPAWLYWIVPTALVLAACILMSTASGRAELARREPDDGPRVSQVPVLRRCSDEEQMQLAQQFLDVFGRNANPRTLGWHLFSCDFYPSLKNDAAVEAYQQHFAPEYVVLFIASWRGEAFVTNVRPAPFPQPVCDYFVFPPNLAWTMLFTHHDGEYGKHGPPFFARHSDYLRLNDENRSALEKVGQVRATMAPDRNAERGGTPQESEDEAIGRPAGYES